MEVQYPHMVSTDTVREQLSPADGDENPWRPFGLLWDHTGAVVGLTILFHSVEVWTPPLPCWWGRGGGTCGFCLKQANVPRETRLLVEVFSLHQHCWTIVFFSSRSRLCEVKRKHREFTTHHSSCPHTISSCSVFFSWLFWVILCLFYM